MLEGTQLELFITFTLAIFLEAAPFLLLGSLVAVLFESLVSADFLARRMPHSRVAQVLMGLTAGLVLPTCECGVVPIARRFLERGVPPAASLTYMLAAPVINPVVLISTWVAFPGRWEMVAGRVLLVALPAVAVGLIVARRRPADILRPPQAPPQPILELGQASPSQPHSLGCGCGCEHPQGQWPGLWRVLAASAAEFLQMGKYLLLGCLAAAAIKTFLSPSLLLPFQENLFLSVVAMMGLAVLLSICSEADAFVAASFVGFPAAAQLSFLAIGPMVDLKLLAMFSAVFKPRMVTLLVALPSLAVLGLSLAWGWLCG